MPKSKISNPSNRAKKIGQPDFDLSADFDFNHKVGTESFQRTAHFYEVDGFRDR